jgi:hypothetical protein
MLNDHVEHGCFPRKRYEYIDSRWALMIVRTAAFSTRACRLAIVILQTARRDATATSVHRLATWW